MGVNDQHELLDTHNILHSYICHIQSFMLNDQNRVKTMVIISIIKVMLKIIRQVNRKKGVEFGQLTPLSLLSDEGIALEYRVRTLSICIYVFH